MKCYIFDIDGTLADCSHRLPHIQKEPKDWQAFFAACDRDAPIAHMVELARDLLNARRTIVYVSGRSDECREATEQWLADNGLIEDEDGLRLYMRAAGDHRDDDILKTEILRDLVNDGYEPVMAFDDRDRVVAAWRANGVPCAQVAEGNF